MGYPVPASFKKTQPRFPGQNLDIYAQKSRNLQIWNEEISPARRYAIFAIDEDDIVTTVKVVSGDALAKLDTTGTLTQKYQAGVNLIGNEGAHLLSSSDTTELQKITVSKNNIALLNPAVDPDENSLMTITDIFSKLTSLIGATFSDIGSDQERNRGAILHEYVSGALGYIEHQDNGQFPDVRHQLLEVKFTPGFNPEKCKFVQFLRYGGYGYILFLCQQRIRSELGQYPGIIISTIVGREIKLYSTIPKTEKSS